MRLKEDDPGWTRKTPHLYRHHNDLIHAVHFQISQWGNGEGGSFTINLGVTEPRLYEVWLGSAFPSNPATALFPVHQRIGHLMSDPPRDHWWDAGPETEVAALAAEVVPAVLLVARPFFASFVSLGSVLEALRGNAHVPGLTGNQPQMLHGLLAGLLGMHQECRAVLRSLIDCAESSAFADSVREAAGRLQVSLP